MLSEYDKFIKKIICNGYSGVSQSAFDAADKHEISVGGWTGKSNRSELVKKCNLKKLSTDDYSEIAEMNIKNSDGTLIITKGEPIGNDLIDMELAKKCNRPYFHCDSQKWYGGRIIFPINSWAKEHGIRVLNVSRASDDDSPNLAFVIIERMIRSPFAEKVMSFIDEITPDDWVVVQDILEIPFFNKDTSDGIEMKKSTVSNPLYIIVTLMEGEDFEDEGTVGRVNGPMQLFPDFSYSELWIFFEVNEYEFANGSGYSLEGTIIHELAHIACERQIALSENAHEFKMPLVNHVTHLNEQIHGPTFRKECLKMLNRFTRIYDQKEVEFEIRQEIEILKMNDFKHLEQKELQIKYKEIKANIRKIRKEILKGDEPAVQSKKKTIISTILEIMYTHPKGISIDSLVEETGLTRKQVMGAISRAKKNGEVKSIKRGVYVRN
jgi:hypothetical protein